MTTQGCTAKNPTTKEIFDFNELKRQPFKYVLNEKTHESLELSICGFLSSKSCGRSSACLTDGDGGTKNLGVFTGKMDYIADGLFDLHFSGGDCKREHSFSLSIVCDPYEIKGRLVFVYRGKDKDPCSLVFEYRTRKACSTNEVGGECVLVDETLGIGFDFGPLTRHPDHPYEIVDGNRKIFLNVCDGVWKCESVSDAACVLSGEHAVSSMGQISKVIEYASRLDRTILLKYSNGDKCNGGNGRTTIQFLCDREAYLGAPTLLKNNDNCRIDVQWKTSLACPELIEPQIGTECKVMNPFTGQMIDLSSKSLKTYYEAKDEAGKVYKVNICDKVHSKECEDAAVCVDGKSLGQVNKTIVFSDGYITLIYESKEKCTDKSQKYKTAVVVVTCDPESDGELEFIHQSTCSTLFSFLTKDLCSSDASSGGGTIDNIVKRLKGPGWAVVSIGMIAVIALGGMCIWKNPSFPLPNMRGLRNVCARASALLRRCFRRREDPAVRFDALGSRDILLDDDSDGDNVNDDVGLLEL